jgi:hypothetical protein
MSQYQPHVGSRLRNTILPDETDIESDGSGESDKFEDYQAPGGPISSRLSSDETDTESVATDFTEDAVTDNGEEHPTSYQARYDRRYEAKQRWNNIIDRLDATLQHANDGAINGYQHAWPAYEEMLVQLQTAATMLRFVIRSIVITCIIGLVKLICRSLFRAVCWLWQPFVDSWVATVDFISEVGEVLEALAEFLQRWGVEIVLRTGEALMNFKEWAWGQLAVFGPWLLQYGVDSAVFVGKAIRAGLKVVWNFLYKYVAIFIDWLVHDGLRYALFTGIVSMISFSIMKGWLGMSLHACDNIVPDSTLNNDTAYDDTGLPVGRSFFQSTCEIDGVNYAIQIVNSELAVLQDASDTVILTTDNMKDPIFLDLSRATGDLTKTVADVKEWARLHGLTDPTISPDDTGALATIPPPESPSVLAEINRHAWEIRNSSEIVRHELQIRYDELNVRLNSIQKYSQKSGTQSDAGLVLYEASYNLLPFAFKLTHTHRQASDYARVARQILEDSLTASILDKTSDIMSSIAKIEVLMVTARQHLTNFQPDWVVACAPWIAIWGPSTTKEDVVEASKPIPNVDIFQRLDDAHRCALGRDPDTWIRKLDAAIFKMKTAAQTLARIDAEHHTILQGLAVVHTQVSDLLDNAAGYKGEPKTPALLPDLLEPRSCDGHARCDGQGRRDPIKITPMCARTILHAFVVHVGEMDVELGRQRTGAEMPVQSYLWTVKDGVVLGTVPPPHWTVRWAKRFGVFADTDTKM